MYIRLYVCVYVSTHGGQGAVVGVRRVLVDRVKRRCGAGGDKAPQCGAVDTTTTATHPPLLALVRTLLVSPRSTDFLSFFPSSRLPHPCFHIPACIIVLIQFESDIISPGHSRDFRKTLVCWVTILGDHLHSTRSTSRRGVPERQSARVRVTSYR